MADISLDTYKLSRYAERLGNVNRRITNLDVRMDRLYWNVGLLDLGNLIKADALTGFSWRLLRCQGYLNQTAADFNNVEKKLTSQDPLSFTKPPVSGLAEVVFDVGAAIKKGADKVEKFVTKAITDVIDSYYSHGTVYKIVEYGKAVVKAAKGVGKVVTAVGSIFTSAGMSLPVAVLTAISGVNDIYNAVHDGVSVYNGEYDKVGENFLKDKLTEAGGMLGSALGNEEIGKMIGKATYFGIDLVTSMEALSNGFDKLKQLDGTNLSKLKTELKEIANLDVNEFLTMGVSDFKYQMKLAGYAYSETSNLISNVSEFVSFTDKGIKFGKSLNNVLTVGASEDWKNPVVETLDKISDVHHVADGIKGILNFDYTDTAANLFKDTPTFVKLNDSIFLSKNSSDVINSLHDIEGHVDDVVSTINDYVFK